MPSSPSSFYPRVFASVTAVVLGYAVLLIIKPFLGPLLWAGLLAILLFPANRQLRTAFRDRRTAAAALLTLATALMLVVPSIFLGIVFGRQATDLVARLQASAAQHQIQNATDVLQLPEVDRVVQRVEAMLPVDADQIRTSVLAGSQRLVESVVSLGGSLFASVFGIVVSIILALFLFFFFVRDGERIIERAMTLVPLDERRKGRLLVHVGAVIQAVVLGSLVTAVAQGTLVGISFALVGLPSPIVFGVLSVGAALIPLVGTAIVWVPAALALGFGGHWGGALFMVVWSVAVVSTADNVIRPLFISRGTNLTTLPVFIGLIGGLSAFGTIGMFLGPVVVALVLALLEFAEEALAEKKVETAQPLEPVEQP
jgi:predicted PurR-regulated permease PerM